MRASAHFIVWLLLVTVALAATPWEGLANRSGAAAAAPMVSAQPAAATGGDGDGDAGCCVCLCSYSSSPLLPAGSPATSIAALSPESAVVLPYLARAPAPHSRLVFHPPRRA